MFSSFANIFTRKRELITLLELSSLFHMTVCVLRFFLMVLWVSLQCVIVVFPDHANLLLHVNCEAGSESFLHISAAKV